MVEQWRFPFNPGLNQSAQLPTSFGPPNMSSQIQGAIGGLVDPILARLKEQQAKDDLAKTRAEMLASGLTTGAGGTASPDTTGSTTPTASVRNTTTAAGSPAGDDNTSVMGGGQSAVKSSEVRDKFIGELREGGLKNPYGLAAMAATGQRESGWSTGNVNRTWQDGQYQSGGTLSWNGPRLRNMQAYTAGADDPVVAQAQFALHENPKLIAQLNAAKSSDEANALMANAWRYKGYNGGPEFIARQNLTRAYASKFARDEDAAPPVATAAAAPAPAPQAAPQAGFAPQVAPAAAAPAFRPTPAPQPAPQAAFAPQVAPAPSAAARAAVTAPQGQQPAPPQQGGMPGMPDYAAAIGAALKNNDQETATMLAQERDMVLAQQNQQGGGGAQAQAPQQQQPSPQEQQIAQQQEIVSNVGQGNQEVTQRLNAQRAEGQAQRTRVASISPDLPDLQLGQTMPGQQPPPPPPPPLAPAPTMAGDPRFSPEPTVLPRFTAPGPPTPTVAPPPAAAAAGAPGRPPPAPAAAPPPPPPQRVAQADIPPAITLPQPQRSVGYTEAQARALLNAAQTPEDIAKTALHIRQVNQQAAQTPTAAVQPNRFKMENGYIIDSLTGAGKRVDAGPDWVDVAFDPVKGVAIQRNVKTNEIQIRGKAGTEVNIGKGEAEEDKEVGKSRAKIQEKYRDEAMAADKTLNRVRTIKGLLANVDTGKLAPGSMTVAAWGRALGVDPKTLTEWGFDPKKAANLQTADAVIGRFLTDMLQSGEFPSSQFSNADARRLDLMQPGIGKEPETNRMLLGLLEVAAERQKQRHVAWRKWQSEQRKAGVERPSVLDFEDEWNASLPDIIPDRPGQAPAPALPRRQIAPGVWIEGR